MFQSIATTTQTSGRAVTYAVEQSPRIGLDPPDPNRQVWPLPCKNVDLQTRGYWQTFRRYGGGGYKPISLVMEGGLQQTLRSNRTGWFFCIPQQQSMMQNGQTPYGAVINLNPSCFGEVYWIGGDVDGVFMAFAVWLPYERWTSVRQGRTTLPIIVHFRPNYDLDEPAYGYGTAKQRASEQGVPIVLARDDVGQPYLDAAWHYLFELGFVQQMLAVSRLAAIVVPVPPHSGLSKGFVDNFTAS